MLNVHQENGSITAVMSSGVTNADAEALVRMMDGAREHVTIDFSLMEFIDIGVGTIIGNALRISAQESRLTVRVPEPGNFSQAWFQLYTRSGLGLAFAQHVRRIMTADGDITERVREYYAHRLRERGANLLYISDIHTGAALDLNEFEVFTHQIYRGLRSVPVPRILFSPQDRLRQILTLVFEAAQNVLDHASKKPLPPNTPLLTYLSIRHRKTISAPRSPMTPLRRYIERLKIESTQAADEYPGFLEIVVTDDGVGMAARQTQSAATYTGPIEAEDAATMRALESGVSVKLTAQDAIIRGTPGFGTSHIREALTALRAFAMIRTGRRLLTFDAQDDDALFSIEPEILGRVSGTALQVIIPHFPTVARDEQVALLQP